MGQVTLFASKRNSEKQLLSGALFVNLSLTLALSSLVRKNNAAGRDNELYPELRAAPSRPRVHKCHACHAKIDARVAEYPRIPSNTPEYPCPGGRIPRPRNANTLPQNRCFYYGNRPRHHREHLRTLHTTTGHRPLDVQSLPPGSYTTRCCSFASMFFKAHLFATSV